MERFGQMLTRFAHTGAQRVRVGEQHEGEPVAVIRAIQHGVLAQQPRVAAGARVAVSLAQVGDAVVHRIQIVWPAKVAVGHRVVEYETRAAHQMASVRVVDGSVVLEEMIEAAAPIDGARVIERHGALHVIEQDCTTAKVRERRAATAAHCSTGSILSSTRSTSARGGGAAPAWRQAAAPVATEKRRCAAHPASGAVIRLYRNPPMLASPAPTVSTTSISGGCCANLPSGRCSSAPSAPRVSKIGTAGLMARRLANPRAGSVVRNRPTRSSSETLMTSARSAK